MMVVLIFVCDDDITIFIFSRNEIHVFSDDAFFLFLIYLSCCIVFQILFVYLVINSYIIWYFALLFNVYNMIEVCIVNKQ